MGGEGVTNAGLFSRLEACGFTYFCFTAASSLLNEVLLVPFWGLMFELIGSYGVKGPKLPCNKTDTEIVCIREQLCLSKDLVDHYS